MKSSKLPVFAIFFSLILLQSCWNDSPEPDQKTPEEIALEELSGEGSLTWEISGGGTVKRDGTAVTDIYQNFELTLNSSGSKSYSSKNSNELFDAAGNWTFEGDNFDKIMLSGSKPAAEREMSFTRTGDNLKLIFTISVPGARQNGTSAVAGTYEFDLVKK